MIKKKVILIAEDDADDRLLIQEAFDELGSPSILIFFEDGDELISYLKGFNPTEAAILPDLFMLDLNMPKTDGKEVLRYLKSQNVFCEIPVVIFTTSKSPEDEASLLNMGAAGFYSKPSSFTNLVDTVQQISIRWIDPNP